MPRSEIYYAIAALVEPGSMTTETIVAEVGETHPGREVKIAVTDMHVDGRLKEHPQFDDVSRVAET